MHVIHVSTAKVWRGGEQQILNLVRGLRERGVDQRMVCRQGKPLAARLRDDGFDVVEWRMGGYLDFRSSFRLAREARQFGTDIFHLHGANAHAFGVRGAGLVTPRPKTVIARRVAYSIYRHSFFGLNHLKYTRGVDRILCVSNEVRRVMSEDGIPDKLLAVVPTGIDIHLIDAATDGSAMLRQELGIPTDAPVVGTVGAHTPEKAQGDFIAAFARVAAARPDVHAVLFGEGPLRGALELAAREAGVGDRVHFGGFRRDIEDLWPVFDVFVLTSLKEGFGSVVLEALAARRPLVATRVGGVPDVIEDGVTGLSVEPGDVPGLAESISTMLDDPVEALAMGAAGRARVEAGFTHERMVERTLAEYQSLLGRA